jgi:hypothetical protein
MPLVERGDHAREVERRYSDAKDVDPRNFVPRAHELALPARFCRLADSRCRACGRI